MKKIITLALIMGSIIFVSCEKKTASPASSSSATATPAAIKVEYRVSAESGQVNVEYTAFEGGVVSTFSKEINRINFNYSFDWIAGKNLSIKASNATPSGKEVLVEIYVNDVLFKTGLANAPGTIASAEGIYN